VFCYSGCTATSFFRRGFNSFFFKVCFTTSLTDTNPFFSTFFKTGAIERIGADGAAGNIGTSTAIYLTTGSRETMDYFACKGFGAAGSLDYI
jgi:hypothetical protein